MTQPLKGTFTLICPQEGAPILGEAVQRLGYPSKVFDEMAVVTVKAKELLHFSLWLV